MAVYVAEPVRESESERESERKSEETLFAKTAEFAKVVADFANQRDKKETDEEMEAVEKKCAEFLLDAFSSKSMEDLQTKLSALEEKELLTVWAQKFYEMWWNKGGVFDILYQYESKTNNGYTFPLLTEWMIEYEAMALEDPME